MLEMFFVFFFFLYLVRIETRTRACNCFARFQTEIHTRWITMTVQNDPRKENMTAKTQQVISSCVRIMFLKLVSYDGFTNENSLGTRSNTIVTVKIFLKTFRSKPHSRGQFSVLNTIRIYVIKYYIPRQT